MVPSINLEGGSGATNGKIENVGACIDAELPWPRGRKKQATIDAANKQLDNLAGIFESRGIRLQYSIYNIRFRVLFKFNIKIQNSLIFVTASEKIWTNSVNYYISFHNSTNPYVFRRPVM